MLPPAARGEAVVVRLRNHLDKPFEALELSRNLLPQIDQDAVMRDEPGDSASTTGVAARVLSPAPGPAMRHKLCGRKTPHQLVQLGQHAGSPVTTTLAPLR
jgi:hypothetical protein